MENITGFYSISAYIYFFVLNSVPNTEIRVKEKYFGTVLDSILELLFRDGLIRGLMI